VSVDISWAGPDADFIGGADLRDKAELVGVPFKITGVYFTKNERGIEYAYVEAEDAAGEEFDFNDSSTTGIRHQLTTYLTLKGVEYAYDGTIYDVNIVAPKGLRVSTYDVTDARNQIKTAKTYYLTSGGRAARAERAKATPTAKATTKTPAK
jgi:hypothetical protein